ncbi:Putative LAGLIDADG endonuclease/maturase (mitochondrion) [Podospora comata]|uniref:LAGLIDADG endonuclease/maturase n=1 Tax=Podospora comata TaxID=48703 RepID=A0ABY6SMT2_PODCO|nr:Putative LAGLIDADG endonuclease/maturase [Podospora comata]VBB87354.1 Putative LAGLIDADG endonuclease/maturase [Podospora comata]
MKNQVNKNFYEWVAGFIDAEGCFHIKRKIMSNNKIRYYFEFVIKLHIDDEAVLRTICHILGVGRVVLRPKYNTCSFEVGSEKELRILIDLLDEFQLMGDKYLDYINFREAFFLYFDRSDSVTESLKTKIEEIRANHNTKRASTTLPVNYKRVITDYKLLGFIEGEGSFIVQTRGLTPKFELELTSAQKPLLIDICEYLMLRIQLIADATQPLNLPSKGGIKIRDRKAKGNSKPSVRLEITGIDFLHNYFNVFLSKLEFYSRKKEDFKSFCFICNKLFSKAHIDNEEVKILLLRLSEGMNGARLSTNKLTDKTLTGKIICRDEETPDS